LVKSREHDDLSDDRQVAGRNRQRATSDCLLHNELTAIAALSLKTHLVMRRATAQEGEAKNNQ
jgi:hypothetical protein